MDNSKNHTTKPLGVFFKTKKKKLKLATKLRVESEQSKDELQQQKKN